MGGAVCAAQQLARAATLWPPTIPPALACLQGDFGPFRPGVPVTVPLWLALRLRDDSLCTVRPPPWLTVAFLAEHLRTEKETTTFSEMPYYYLEVCGRPRACAFAGVSCMASRQALPINLSH